MSPIGQGRVLAMMIRGGLPAASLLSRTLMRAGMVLAFVGIASPRAARLAMTVGSGFPNKPLRFSVPFAFEASAPWLALRERNAAAPLSRADGRGARGEGRPAHRKAITDIRAYMFCSPSYRQG